MATKKKKSRRRSGSDPVARIRRAITRLEKEGAALIKRTRRDATRYVSGNHQKALASLMKQARSLGSDLERRVRRSGRDIEKRAEKAVARVEKRLLAGVTASAKTLMLATQGDVTRLQREVADLERRIEALGGRREVPSIPIESRTA